MFILLAALSFCAVTAESPRICEYNSDCSANAYCDNREYTCKCRWEFYSDDPFTTDCVRLCALPRDSGDCDGSKLSWFYNPSTSMCEEFRYGGCGGNPNRFRDHKSCMKKCDSPPPECPENSHPNTDFDKHDRPCVCDVDYHLDQLEMFHCIPNPPIAMCGDQFCAQGNTVCSSDGTCQCDSSHQDFVLVAMDLYNTCIAEFYDCGAQECHHLNTWCDRESDDNGDDEICRCRPGYHGDPLNGCHPYEKKCYGRNPPHEDPPHEDTPCSDLEEMWYYNHIMRDCMPFSRIGCEPLENSYPTKTLCLSSCGECNCGDFASCDVDEMDDPDEVHCKCDEGFHYPRDSHTCVANPSCSVDSTFSLENLMCLADGYWDDPVQIGPCSKPCNEPGDPTGVALFSYTCHKEHPDSKDCPDDGETSEGPCADVNCIQGCEVFKRRECEEINTENMNYAKKFDVLKEKDILAMMKFKEHWGADALNEKLHDARCDEEVLEKMMEHVEMVGDAQAKYSTRVTSAKDEAFDIVGCKYGNLEVQQWESYDALIELEMRIGEFGPYVQGARSRIANERRLCSLRDGLIEEIEVVLDMPESKFDHGEMKDGRFT